jgi:hypothetical protein
MTKDEINTMDWVLLSPVILILNQYFNCFFDEHYVLWAALVSKGFHCNGVSF